MASINQISELPIFKGFNKQDLNQILSNVDLQLLNSLQGQQHIYRDDLGPIYQELLVKHMLKADLQGLSNEQKNKLKVVSASMPPDEGFLVFEVIKYASEFSILSPTIINQHLDNLYNNTYVTHKLLSSKQNIYDLVCDFVGQISDDDRDFISLLTDRNALMSSNLVGWYFIQAQYRMFSNKYSLSLSGQNFTRMPRLNLNFLNDYISDMQKSFTKLNYAKGCEEKLSGLIGLQKVSNGLLSLNNGLNAVGKMPKLNMHRYLEIGFFAGAVIGVIASVVAGLSALFLFGCPPVGSFVIASNLALLSFMVGGLLGSFIGSICAIVNMHSSVIAFNNRLNCVSDLLKTDTEVLLNKGTVAFMDNIVSSVHSSRNEMECIKFASEVDLLAEKLINDPERFGSEVMGRINYFKGAIAKQNPALYKKLKHQVLLHSGDKSIELFDNSGNSIHLTNARHFLEQVRARYNVESQLDLIHNKLKESYSPKATTNDSVLDRNIIAYRSC